MALLSSILKSMVTSFPETDDKVAVSVTSVGEFSVILSSLNANTTVGNSLISVKVTAIGSALAKSALLAVAFKIMVSSFSSLVSSIPEKVNAAVVSPAAITSCGETAYF